MIQTDRTKKIQHWINQEAKHQMDARSKSITENMKLKDISVTTDAAGTEVVELTIVSKVRFKSDGIVRANKHLRWKGALDYFEYAVKNIQIGIVSLDGSALPQAFVDAYLRCLIVREALRRRLGDLSFDKVKPNTYENLTDDYAMQDMIAVKYADLINPAKHITELHRLFNRSRIYNVREKARVWLREKDYYEMPETIDTRLLFSRMLALFSRNMSGSTCATFADFFDGCIDQDTFIEKTKSLCNPDTFDFTQCTRQALYKHINKGMDRCKL